MTNHHKVQDTRANLKAVRDFKVLFSEREGLISKGLITGIEKAIQNKILFASLVLN